MLRLFHSCPMFCFLWHRYGASGHYLMQTVVCCTFFFFFWGLSLWQVDSLILIISFSGTDCVASNFILSSYLFLFSGLSGRTGVGRKCVCVCVCVCVEKVTDFDLVCRFFCSFSVQRELYTTVLFLLRSAVCWRVQPRITQFVPLVWYGTSPAVLCVSSSFPAAGCGCCPPFPIKS